MAQIGGRYFATPATYADGDIVESIPTDANGNLMVNVAAGESINIGTMTVGTIDALKAGTINSGTINAGTMSMPIIYANATVTVGSGKLSGTTAVAENGIVYKITQACGTFSGTPGTITTQLVDALGGTIATLAAQAESSKTTYSTVVPLHTNMSWITTASDADGGTQNAANSATIALYYSK